MLNVLTRTAVLALSSTALVSGVVPDQASAASAVCIAVNARTDNFSALSRPLTIAGFEAGDVITVTAQYLGPGFNNRTITVKFGGMNPPFFSETGLAINEIRSSGPNTFNGGTQLVVDFAELKVVSNNFLVSYNCVDSTPAGSTPSGNLNSQQQTFTSQAMTQTAQNLGDGMTQNILGQFNGTGAFNVANNRFFIQSASMQNWLYRRRKEIIDKERRIAMRARKRRIKDTSVPNKNVDPNAIEPNNTTILPAASYPSASKASPMFNAWAKGMFTYYDGKGSSFDGSLIDIMVGLDYKITDYFLVGLLGGYNNADFDTLTAGTAGKFKADGFSVGPYLGVKLSHKVIFDALIAYTRSDYDNRSGATTGDFNADRITFAANLTGTWDLPYALFIEPSIGFSYASEKQENYIDSAATAHASTTIKAGRFSVGPKIGKAFKTDNGTLTPWVGAYFVYDFSNAGTTPGSGLPDLGDITSARIATGLNAVLQGFTISLTGDVTGIGTSAYTAYRGQVKVNVPF